MDFRPFTEEEDDILSRIQNIKEEKNRIEIELIEEEDNFKSFDSAGRTATINFIFFMGITLVLLFLILLYVITMFVFKQFALGFALLFASGGLAIFFIISLLITIYHFIMMMAVNSSLKFWTQYAASNRIENISVLKDEKHRKIRDLKARLHKLDSLLEQRNEELSSLTAKLDREYEEFLSGNKEHIEDENKPVSVTKDFFANAYDFSAGKGKNVKQLNISDKSEGFMDEDTSHILKMKSDLNILTLERKELNEEYKILKEQKSSNSIKLTVIIAVLIIICCLLIFGLFYIYGLGKADYYNKFLLTCTWMLTGFSIILCFFGIFKLLPSVINNEFINQIADFFNSEKVALKYQGCIDSLRTVERNINAINSRLDNILIEDGGNKKSSDTLIEEKQENI